MVAFYRKFLTKKALAGALVSKIGILAVVRGLFCTLLYLAYQIIMQDGIIVLSEHARLLGRVNHIIFLITIRRKLKKLDN